MKQLPLTGARVLHVEDEVLIALEVESICQDNGAEIVTHMTDLDQADRTLSGGFDVALLDLFLHGRCTLDLAQRLDAAGIPVVFISGHDRSRIDPAFPHARFVAKPFRSEDLIAAVEDAIKSRPQPTLDEST